MEFPQNRLKKADNSYQYNLVSVGVIIGQIKTPFETNGRSFFMSTSIKNDIQVLLDQTVEQLNGLKNGFSREINGLSELKDRLFEGRFHLAVLGQFKRGKSTLLNALLGEAVLPTAVIPLTAIPTFIQASQKLSARVLFEDEKSPAEFMTSDSNELVDFLSKYVAETNNPANQLNVQQVEVFHTAKILCHGVVLIDTPGIG